MGNSFATCGTKQTFKWRIEGVSSLLEVPSATHLSRPFTFGGYSWNLQMQPRNIDSKSGKECMGLHLQLDDASSLPSDLVLNTAYELCVYDQLRNSHRIYRVDYYFRSNNKADGWGYHNIILHDSLKDPTSGFLLNDICHVGVKFLKFRAEKVDRSNVFECLSLEKKPAAQMFTWKIENFTKLPRPDATSMNFVAGGHKWNIRMYPDGIDKSGDYLSIFLELQTTPALHELYAEFSLSLLDQINGNHKKFTAKSRFSEAAYTFGVNEFLPLEDFQDPSKGFLVENACAIEASVMVLGSSTRPL